MKKLIKESLYEKFSEDGDPIVDMGIGMRAQIKQWFDSIGVKPDKYTIDDNLNIIVKRSLDLEDAQITELPDNLKVNWNLYLRGTQITKLPDNLSVGGNLSLRGTQITQLPDNLKVGWNLDLRRTEITELPDNLSVGGKIYKDF